MAKNEKPSSAKLFSTRLDPLLIKKIKMQAVKEECKMSTLVEKILREYFENKETHGTSKH